MRLPNFIECETIFNLFGELSEIETKQKENPEDVTVVADLEEALEKLDNLVWKISKLKKDKLTPWEQNLVHEQVLNTVTDVTMTSVGKQPQN